MLLNLKLGPYMEVSIFTEALSGNFMHRTSDWANSSDLGFYKRQQIWKLIIKPTNERTDMVKWLRYGFGQTSITARQIDRWTERRAT